MRHRVAWLVSLSLLVHVTRAQAQGAGVAAAPGRLADEQVRLLVEELRPRIEAMLRSEAYLPGLAIAVVGREGVLWTEGFGHRDRSRTARVDADTMFGVLSISKSVTVTGLMVAAQEGLIDLDVPIERYLPGFTVHSRFPADPMSEITIRHLVSMTSGLTHDAPLGNNADASSPSYEAHLRSFSRTWLRFRTGTRTEYSGMGTELAAHCLERVIHRPFTEYLQEKVFGPLGMDRTTYDVRRILAEPNRAIGNNRNIERLPVEIPMLAPAGVYSSVADLARFLRLHLELGTVEGRTILKEELARQMQVIPFPLPGQVSGYGLGFWVKRYHLGGRDVQSVEHGGGGFGFLTQLKWLPELGYGVVVLTNSSDQDYGHERLAEDVLLRIIGLLTGKQPLGPAAWLEAHAPPRSVAPGYVPADLAGRYSGTNDDMVFLVRDGRFGFVSDNAFEPLVPVSPDEYLSARYLYRFVRGPGGAPTAVVRPYDGTTWLLGVPERGPRGPDRKEWARYVGSYVRKRFGVGEKLYDVSVKDGWLYFRGGGQDLRLTEHLPGLFFTPDGEAVDLRGDAPTYRNIRLYRARD